MSLRQSMRGWRTRVRRVFGGTDRRRWGDLGNLDGPWNDRTRFIASLVPDGSRVLEFGAGLCSLGGHLPSGCSYTPTDIVSRRPDCLVVDLNGRNLPQLPPHDVAVFSGVLEYVHDLGRVAGWLAPAAGQVIASYAVFDGADRIRVRRSRGWVSDWSRDAFVEVFANAGFDLEEQALWSGGRNVPPQPVFVFAGGGRGDRSAVRSARSARTPAA